MAAMRFVLLAVMAAVASAKDGPKLEAGFPVGPHPLAKNFWNTHRSHKAALTESKNVIARADDAGAADEQILANAKAAMQETVDAGSNALEGLEPVLDKLSSSTVATQEKEVPGFVVVAPNATVATKKSLRK